MSEINLYRELTKDNKEVWVCEYIEEPAIRISVKGNTPDEAREKLNKILDKAKVINNG